jgi:hypothetical protein
MLSAFSLFSSDGISVSSDIDFTALDGCVAGDI